MAVAVLGIFIGGIARIAGTWR